MVRIIDASVALKWFVLEPGRDEALSLLGEVLKSPTHFAVPELFFFELVHVFHRVVPLPSESHGRLLDRLLSIGILRFSMTPQLLEETRFFQGLGLSGCDGAYCGLARILKGKWITFDQKAHAVVNHLNISEIL